MSESILMQLYIFEFSFLFISMVNSDIIRYYTLRFELKPLGFFKISHFMLKWFVLRESDMINLANTISEFWITMYQCKWEDSNKITDFVTFKKALVHPAKACY